MRVLFGNDDAIYDKLLRVCYVDPLTNLYRPILIGRWGIGKSAITLHLIQNSIDFFDNALSQKGLWYIGEGSIDRAKLATLDRKDELELMGGLESLWKAEITRIECLMLSILYDHYKPLSGKHWETINAVANDERSLGKAWERVPEITSIIRGDKSASTVVDRATLEKIFSEEILNSIVDCLNDINGKPIQPIIMIEPIDTPKSGLEDDGIAQKVVSSLLNVYYKKLLKFQEPIFWIRICIPWHRWKPSHSDLPQKMSSYATFIKWSNRKLREFIDSRIKWEFDYVGRKGKGEDYWSQLFGSVITNDAFEKPVDEDCFSYILRHTHHRPRDLQRMARKIVENQADQSRVQPDDILYEKEKITQQVIKESVKEVCSIKMENEFFVEMERRYKRIDIPYIIDLVSGLSIPFGLDDIVNRHKILMQEQNIKPGQLYYTLRQLWESGIIGIEITPPPEATSVIMRHLRNILPSEGYIKHTWKSGKVIERWFFFEYNWTESQPPFALIKRFGNAKGKDGEAQFVLHPATFEKLMPSYRSEYPLGV